MKKLFALLIIILTCAMVNSAMASTVLRKKDFRFTTNQDREERIKRNTNNLKAAGVFQDKVFTEKSLEKYNRDLNYKEHVQYVKELGNDDEISFPSYNLKGIFPYNADKILTYYSLRYNTNPPFCYVYNLSGRLVYIEILHDADYVPPYTISRYLLGGKLIVVKHFATDGGEYIFDSKGKFRAIVIKKMIYNRNGSTIKTLFML